MKNFFCFFKNQGVILIALVGASLCILFSMITFDIQVNQYIQKDMHSQVNAVQKNSVRLLQNEMNYRKQITASAAKFMSQSKYETDSDIIQALKDYTQSTDLYRALFITLEGEAYTNYAGYLGQDDANKNLDGIALSEIHTTIFSKPRYSKELDKVVFGVVTPAVLANKTGVLVSSYNIEELYSLLENELMDRSSEIGILNQQGEVIVGKNMDDFQLNIFDVFLQYDIPFSNNSPNGMRQDFAKGISGFSSYSVNGMERYCSYAPMEFNDWYIIAMVEESVLRNNSAALKHYGTQLTLELILIMAALLLIITFTRHKEQNRIQSVLQDLAMFDGLTHVYNRATAESKIANYLEGAGKAKTHVLFIMDIDNFKMLNDNFGHIFGDFVLKEFAQRLKTLSAKQDIVGRIGGDEFIVLVKNCSDFTRLQEKAREIITNFCVTTDTGVNQPISISLGVALFDTDGRTFMELYKHADDALYRAKNQGKSQFSF